MGYFDALNKVNFSPLKQLFNLFNFSSILQIYSNQLRSIYCKMIYFDLLK